MINIENIKKSIFKIENEENFNKLAIDIFHYQYEHSKVYKSFVDNLNVNASQITNYQKIPFLPIEFFKTQEVCCFNKNEAEAIFSSSGTTGQNTSKHFVKDLTFYENSFTKAFELFFNKIEGCAILALLPSYLERKESSLVYMAEKLIEKSNVIESGFYLYNYKELLDAIASLSNKGIEVILIGVTFALLDIAEKHNLKFNNLSIIETGGMKGRRKEIIRSELHDILRKGFGTNKICSEYGMTELLSQAYSLKDELFTTPPWMKILIRDTNDPLQLIEDNKTGGINVIDLANIHTCSFIATQDLGKLHSNGEFEILGRFDHSDTRGCNLLIS